MAAAVGDAKVAQIVMLVDSPGGYAMGIERAVDAVRGANAQKPVHAYARNMMASAAMWIGAQARTITASRMADVGSIGVYTILEDSTKYFEKQGITRHLIKAGLYKGVGADGIPVTEQDLQVVASEVVAIYDSFVTDIAAGRKIDRAKALALADGRTHTGESLLATGLVDKLGRLDELVNELNSLTAGAGRPGSGARVSTAQEFRTMADENKNETGAPARVAATAVELRTAFPDDAEFRFGCLEKGLTLLEAKADYSGVLAGKLAESNKKAAELQGQLAEAKAAVPAAQPQNDAARKEAARLAFAGATEPGNGAAAGSPGLTLEAGAQTVLREALARGDRISLATATWRAAKDPRFAHLHQDWLKRQGRVAVEKTA